MTKAWLSLAAAALLPACAPARAEPPAAATTPALAPSGAYTSDTGQLLLLEDEESAVVSYTASFTPGSGDVHVCSCTTRFRRIAPGRFVREEGKEVAATLELKNSSLVLAPGPGSWSGCCGAGWPGDRFPRGAVRPPRTCKMRAATNLLRPGDSDPRPSGARAEKGQSIDVVDGGGAEKLVLARLRTGSRAEVGLVPRSSVACGRR